MGITPIQSRNLPTGELANVLDRLLEGRFAVYESWLPAVDLIVKRNAMVGVGVRILRKNGEVRIRCVPITPSHLLRGLLGFNMLLHSHQEAMVTEVEAILRGCPEAVGDAAASQAVVEPLDHEPRSAPVRYPGPLRSAIGGGLAMLSAGVVIGLAYFDGFEPTIGTVGFVALAACFALVFAKMLPAFRPRLRGAVIVSVAVVSAQTFGVLTGMLLNGLPWSQLPEALGWSASACVSEPGLLQLFVAVVAGVATGSFSSSVSAEMAPDNAYVRP